MSSLLFQIVPVTPEMAKKWLETLDPEQRRLRPLVVDQYARDMISGAWKLTHQPIAFNVLGQLIDGQHRLNAIVESGQVIPLAVARNVEGDYSLPIDGGFRRTPKDLLHLPTQTISAATMLRKLQSGTVNLGFRQSKSSVEETRETYVRYQADVDAGCSAITRGIVTASAAGAIAFARPIDSEKIDRFSRDLREGVGLSAGSPSLSLRNWLTRNRSHSMADVAMATLNAANAELKGTSIASVYTTPSGYEHICQRRRALRILDTPPANRIAVVSAPVQTRVLELLRSQGQTSYADICAHLGERSTVVSDALHKLKKKGMVSSPMHKQWTAEDVE